MSWLDYGPLLSIVVGYLLFLFGVAYWAERTPPAGAAAPPDAHLRPHRIGLLHGMDVLRQRGAGGEPGAGVPDDLPRPGPDRPPLAGAPAPARAGRQGAADHVHLRLHLEPLRQVGAAGRPGGRPRRGRADPVHRAPAPGGVPVLQGDPPAGGDPRPVRSHPPGGGRAGAVRDPLRRAQPRFHAGAAGPADGGRRRVGGQAAGVPHRRRLRDLGPVRGVRRPVRPDARRPRAEPAGHRSASRRPRPSRAGRRCSSSR